MTDVQAGFGLRPERGHTVAMRQVLGWLAGAGTAAVAVVAAVVLMPGGEGPPAPPDSAPLTVTEAPVAAGPVAEAAAPAAAEPAPAAVAVPEVRELRVEPDGMAVIAGTAEPGAEVEILVDSVPVARASAGSDGQFAEILMLGAAEVARVLSLQSEAGGEVVASDQMLIIAPVVADAEPEVAIADAPGTDPVAAPPATAADDPGLAAADQPDVDIPEVAEAPAPAADVVPPEPSLPETVAPESVAPADVPGAVPEAGTETAAAADDGTADVTVAPAAEAVAAPANEAAENDVVAHTAPADDPPEAGAPVASPAAEVPPQPAPAAETPVADSVAGQTAVVAAAPAPERAAAPPPAPAGAVTGEGNAAATPAAPALPAAPAPEPVAPALPVAPAPAAVPALPAAPAPEPAAPALPVAPAPAAVPPEVVVQPPDLPGVAAADSPARPPVLLADAEGVRLLQPAIAPGAGPDVLQTVALDTISYDDTGAVVLAGRAAGGGFVRVYVDNAPVGTGPVEGAQWSVVLRGVDPGVYTLRVDQLDATGAVISRIETPFRREARETIAAAMADQPSGTAGISVRTVQPGHTLWAIARERYGRGILYVEVFEANRDRIRDPDLIYPGQVFVLPEVPAAALE